MVSIHTREKRAFTHSNSSKVLGLFLLITLAFQLRGRPNLAPPIHSTADFPIPTQSDWTDYGPIFTSGALGEWDHILWGGFAGTAVKKDGVYYLYYQGVSGYQLEPDETVIWRTMGVATSPDGINFTKHAHNPILSWFPNNDGEEGAVSGGVTLDESGEIVLYYGANTELDATQVNADGRLTTSTNGRTFTDQGIALDHTDGSVWGSGDELFPVIAFQDAGQWFVYYIPNGTGSTGRLGVAWGNSRDTLSSSAGAVSGGQPVKAWGMGGYANVGPDTYGLFINNVRDATFEVRTVSTTTPDQLSAPVENYQFDDVQQATVLLDVESSTWFMYYRGAGIYGVKLAPAGAPDTSPPTAPGNVTATPVSAQQIDLSWNPATDADTGIVLYNVFRDGAKIATVKGTHFTDSGLSEQTMHSYKVSAVNYHGTEGPRSAALTATTPADTTRPTIAAVSASGTPIQVSVIFDEPVEKASAETAANYLIDYAISVLDATLGADFKTVTLTTSAHIHGTYRIFVSGVRDRAAVPRTILPASQAEYSYRGAPGLVGAWTFDEGTGTTTGDTGNYGNDGQLLYLSVPGPAWTAGKFGQALKFDGVDDQVTLDGRGTLDDITDGSHTFAAWVKPADLPPANTANDTQYTILARAYAGLHYTESGKFMANVRLADNTFVSVSSPVLDPAAWHHVVMVVDDVAQALHLYVDGQAVGASPVAYSDALADHDGAPYYIGTAEPLTNFYEQRFKGSIDDVLIFDQALSEAEVTTLWDGFETYLSPSRAAAVEVFVAPESIAADLTSTATLTATARDGEQTPLPDGRVVQFTTTKGNLANYGLGVIGGGQGSATLQLTAGATAGTAEITAALDGITDSTTLEMLEVDLPAIFLPLLSNE